jgi:hypothetical protein
LRDAGVRRAYTRLWARHRAVLADLLATTARRLGVSLRMPAPDLVDLLGALTRGLVLQSAVGRPAGAITVADALVRFLRNELSPPRLSRTRSSARRC